MRRSIVAMGFLLLAVGCGQAPDVHRPVALTIGGLSSRAERLVVKVFPESTGQTCIAVTLQTAGGLAAPFEVRWARSEQGGNRRLSLPEVDESRVTLVAHSEEADGRVIQFACLGLDYLDLESPEIFIMLSRRET